MSNFKSDHEARLFMDVEAMAHSKGAKAEPNIHVINCGVPTGIKMSVRGDPNFLQFIKQRTCTSTSYAQYLCNLAIDSGLINVSDLEMDVVVSHHGKRNFIEWNFDDHRYQSEALSDQDFARKLANDYIKEVVVKKYNPDSQYVVVWLRDYFNPMLINKARTEMFEDIKKACTEF